MTNIDENHPKILHIFAHHCAQGWSARSFCGKLYRKEKAFARLMKRADFNLIATYYMKLKDTQRSRLYKERKFKQADPAMIQMMLDLERSRALANRNRLQELAQDRKNAIDRMKDSMILGMPTKENDYGTKERTVFSTSESSSRI